MPTQGERAASRRACPLSACAFNPSCTVAIVSTIAGLRPLELLNAASAPHDPIARSLLPAGLCERGRAKANAIDAGRTLPSAAAAYSSTSPSSPSPSLSETATSRTLWETPVYVATVAGDSALVAVVFRARPSVFAPATHTMSASNAMGLEQHDKDAAPHSSAGVSTTVDAAGRVDAVDARLGAGSLDNMATAPTTSVIAEDAPHVPSVTAAELFAVEAEYRRYVYLFDATSGQCLAALHFCGSPVAALRANAAVLLVAAVDLFHIVELDTLRYVRQQSMFKPQNPHSVIDLSSAVPVKVRRVNGQSASAAPAASPSSQTSLQPQFTYAVAYPQSARGYHGDVTVLTLHTTSLEFASQAAHTTSEASPIVAPPAQAAMQQRTIPAHHHAIAHLRLRRDGRVLVTASQLGTTLKLFDCVTGQLLVELQRGHRPASVLSLGVQHDAYRVAALSTNGTLHVFNCAAVVQSWEAGQRWASPTPTTATSGAAASSSLNKARADYKLKVFPLCARESRGLAGRLSSSVAARSPSLSSAEHSAAGAGTTLPSDGCVQYEVGFTTDGRTVWVAQVESTNTQLALARSLSPTESSAAAAAAGEVGRSDDTIPSKTRVRDSKCRGHCIGTLTCFPVLPPGRAVAATADVAGASFSIDI